MSRHLLPVGLVMVVSAVWVPGAAAQFKMPKVGGWAGEAGKRASQGGKDLSSDMDDAWRKRGPKETPGRIPGTFSQTPDRLVVDDGGVIQPNRGASSAVAPRPAPANKPDPWRQFGEAIGREIRASQQNQMQQNQNRNNGYRQNNYQYRQNGSPQNYQLNGYTNSYPGTGNVVVRESSPVYVDQSVVAAKPVISAAVPVNVLPYKGPGVTIVLPETTGGEVSYLLDGTEQGSIRAGEERKLATKSAYEIRFSRGRTAEGKDHGEARYTISEGTYHFEVTDRGWELLRQKQ